MKKVYVQGESGLIPLQEDVTARDIDNALGYTPANADDIIESIDESDDTALYVTDKNGKIITRTDREGFHAAAMTVNGMDVESGLVTDEDRASWGGSDLDDVISKDDDTALYITDSADHIIAKIDREGVHATEVYVKSSPVTVLLDAMTQALGGKVDGTTFDDHTANTDVHIGDEIKLDDNSAYYITDEVGNILFKVDATGTHATEIYINKCTDGLSEILKTLSDAIDKETWDTVTNKVDSTTFNDHVDDNKKHLGDEIKLDNDKALCITDSADNVIAQFDEQGLNVAQLKINHIPVEEHVRDMIENNNNACSHTWMNFPGSVDDLHPEADCTTWRRLRYCTSCGKIHAFLIRTDHVWTVDREVDPTCTDDGYKSYICQECSAEGETVAIPATGHSMGEWYEVVAPACEEKGQKCRDCDNCDYSETEEIPATGHDESDWIIDKPATSMSEGQMHTECKVCGTLMQHEYIPAVEAESDGTFTYKLLDDLTYEIAAIDVNNVPANLIIPSTYNDKPVTVIGSYAFNGSTVIETVTIPNTITTIKDRAFAGNDMLRRVWFLSVDSTTYTIATIEEYAFYSCDSFEAIVLPHSITTVGYYAFADCPNLIIYSPEPVKPNGWNFYWYGANLAYVRAVKWDYPYDGYTITYNLTNVINAGSSASYVKGANEVLYMCQANGGYYILDDPEYLTVENCDYRLEIIVDSYSGKKTAYLYMRNPIGPVTVNIKAKSYVGGG